jgi:hypothetical protein
MKDTPYILTALFIASILALALGPITYVLLSSCYVVAPI